MKKKQRKHLPVSEKLAALRRHLLGGEPVSAICDELGISPSNFYGWQKLLFDNGEKAFQRESSAELKKVEAQVSELEQTLRVRDEALADLMTEHVALKKRVNGKR